MTGTQKENWGCLVVLLCLFISILVSVLGFTLESRPSHRTDCTASDGDTIRCPGYEKALRIENIDGPEKGWRAKCQEELELNYRATKRLQEILTQGVIIRVLPRTCAWGRPCVLLTALHGEDVGEMLVREGLAIRWQGKMGEWCPTASQAAPLQGQH